MSGKTRPSLRRKTLENVNRCDLSQTDKDCINHVFQLVDEQAREIKNQYVEIKVLKSDLFTTKQDYENAESLLKQERKKVENVKQKLINAFKSLKTESYKVFADRLIEIAETRGGRECWVDIDDIIKTLQKLTEEG